MIFIQQEVHHEQDQNLCSCNNRTLAKWVTTCHAELVSASVVLCHETLKQVQGDAEFQNLPKSGNNPCCFRLPPCRRTHRERFEQPCSKPVKFRIRISAIMTKSRSGSNKKNGGFSKHFRRMPVRRANGSTSCSKARRFRAKSG